MTRRARCGHTQERRDEVQDPVKVRFRDLSESVEIEGGVVVHPVDASVEDKDVGQLISFCQSGYEGVYVLTRAHVDALEASGGVFDFEFRQTTSVYTDDVRSARGEVLEQRSTDT